jgi:fatty acid synthase subunit alpha
MIVGGTEDFGEEGSFEFGSMGATCNTDKEKLAGWEPNQMCRPTTSTRAGFMEAQGAGIQILMNAQTALQMV